MDAVAGLLDGPRARDAFLMRTSFDPPWGLRIEDQAPLTICAMLQGHCWWVPDEGDAVLLRAGDVATIRGPDPYFVGDDPATPARAVIDPGGHCRSLDGRPLFEDWSQGVRSWGGTPDGAMQMFCGAYNVHGDVSNRLLRALPQIIVLRRDEWDSPLVGLMAEEIARDVPGQEAVLDRMLDLLLISFLRTWFARPDAEAPGWYRAHADPVVGHALRLLHHNPAHPWTVAELARQTNVSRAALARRFHELVGEPPMSFLTGWRIALAADLLREPGATLASVAEQVGYSTPFALSAAFKRVRGVSPQEHRAAVAA